MKYFPIYNSYRDECIKNDLSFGDCNDSNWYYKNGIISNKFGEKMFYKKTNNYYDNIILNKDAGTKFNKNINNNNNNKYKTQLTFRDDILYELSGDNKRLRVRPYNIYNRKILDFESPIFDKNNEKLLYNWYNNKKLDGWKEKIKKYFRIILKSDLNMMNNCCIHKKYNKDLCGEYWGPSESCERLLSNEEKLNCCRGYGSIYKCGKHWGPNRSEHCKKFINDYCIHGDGHGTEMCTCFISKRFLNEKDKKLLKRLTITDCNWNTSFYNYLNPNESKYIQENFNNRIILDTKTILLIILIGFLLVLSINLFK